MHPARAELETQPRPLDAGLFSVLNSRPFALFRPGPVIAQRLSLRPDGRPSPTILHLAYKPGFRTFTGK